MKHIVYNLDTGARDLTLSDCEPCTTGPINHINNKNVLNVK